MLLQGVPVVPRKRIQLISMRMRVQSLVSLRGLGIRRGHDLWCMSQKQLGSGWLWRRPAAVAPIHLTPVLGTSICRGCGPKKKKKKEKKKKTNASPAFRRISQNFLAGTFKQVEKFYKIKIFSQLT